ncbi:MAG: hypothetical protein U0168_19250 [Nannocystaceae bacterium]
MGVHDHGRDLLRERAGELVAALGEHLRRKVARDDARARARAVDRQGAVERAGAQIERNRGALRLDVREQVRDRAPTPALVDAQAHDAVGPVVARCDAIEHPLHLAAVGVERCDRARLGLGVGAHEDLRTT